MQSFCPAFQEMHMMSKRLPAALTAAALCTLFGALHAQTSDAPDPTGQQRYQQPSGAPPSEPAEALPSSTPVAPPIVYETSVPINRETIPSSRTDVQSDTRAAVRARAIPRGELSTPEQDKGSDRALAPFERGMSPNDYAH